MSWLLPLAQNNPSTQFLVLAQQIRYFQCGRMIQWHLAMMPCIRATWTSIDDLLEPILGMVLGLFVPKVIANSFVNI